uniref:SH2 domain-containing protein n=1 Tax=Mesocestoides corti TaxID=53468 RepID=A0A5K3FYJ5_MESCO
MRLVLLSCFSFAPHSPLQGRLNDQDGWFPASHVDIPFTADSPPRPVLRRQSTSNVMITSPSESLAFCSISPRAELLPIPSTAAVCGSDANGISIARSSSLRTYAVPNSNGTATITSRHFSSTAAPSVVGKVMATSSPILPSHSSMPWYFGEMDRAEATQLLTGCEDGTFLVRISKNVSRMGEYSLSVVYHHPRHIRIQRSADSSFYLCSPQRFKSLEALVDFYCRVSLNECFDEVQTCLRFPYQRCPEESVLFYARAQHDFGGDANPRMLSLTRGDLVHVISTRGNERGWWKGWLNGRIGFFPLSFVSRQP